MEALDVQAAAAEARKSPRLAAMTRLLLQGDLGQSSSCCDFPSSREEQNATRNNPCTTNSNARLQQRHRAVGTARLPLTRFEQQAEQLLHQDQGLQVDQILDLLGLLLKRQHPGAERETSVSHQQQAAVSLSAAGAVDAKRQAQSGVASPANTALEAATAVRRWTNADELSPRGENGIALGGGSAADDAEVAREFLRRRRDSNTGVLRRSQHLQQEQQQQRVVNSHSAAAGGGSTATNGSHGSLSHFTVVGNSSDSQAYLEQRRQLDQQHLISERSAEWRDNSLQLQSRGMVVPAAGTAAVGAAESVSPSNGSGNAAYWVLQQQKSAPYPPLRLPVQVGTSAVDPLGTASTTGTHLREARQQRQHLQHPMPRQQELQQHQGCQQQLQLQRTRSHQYLVDQHPASQRQDSQPVPQHPFGQRHLQELQQQHHQQTETKLQRGEIDENVLNDETRRLLSKSLDVLMGDVNIQTLKDLLLRRGPLASNGSRANIGGSAETTYSYATQMTAGDLDAAVQSLLQQQPHQQQQHHQPHSQEQLEADGEVLSRNCALESKRQQQTLLENKHRPGGENGDELAFSVPAVSPALSAGNDTAQDRRCSARSMDEGSHVTAIGQLQHSHLRRVQERQVLQEQVVQQEERTTDLKTDTAAVSSYFEGVLPYYSSGSPMKNEGLNNSRNDTVETPAAAGSAVNKRPDAAQRQELQQPDKKRGRTTRHSLLNDKQEKGRQRPANGSSTVAAATGCAALISGATAEQDDHEQYREVRRARLSAGRGRTACSVESSPSDDSPAAPRWAGATLTKNNACTDLEGAAAAAEEVGSFGCAKAGRSSCENFKQAPAVRSKTRHRLAAASLSSGLMEERDRDILDFFGGAPADNETAEGTVTSAGKKRLAAGNPSETEKHLAATEGNGQVFEGEAPAEAPETVSSGRLPSRRTGKRRVQEPCELSLAAARLEQRGHTFTPPFCLNSPADAMSSSTANSRCNVMRENSRRSDAAGGGEDRRKKASECFHNGNTATGEVTRVAVADEQERDALSGVEEQVDGMMNEDEEEKEGEDLTQQQVTLLKHIYSVLSQAEEYFSFKSALYQLHIKRHLKKCVSSLTVAGTATSAGSDKDASPSTAAGGGSKVPRSSVYAGNTQSKAIRLFTSMPPIPINAVEQRALLSVRRHLQAGGGGALLCQGDGVTQVLMEELDELLTSLVNKLLLIIVVKFQTCFIHAPARAQLREFLVSFVFPGDMATQLLFRDHVQAVVHARIRHFRDSVGRTLRHQPPPSPPMAATSIPRSGRKRGNRGAASSASSPTSCETEEEGDEEEDKQKKQKVCEVPVDGDEQRNRRRAAAALPAGRTRSSSHRRKASPAFATGDALADTTTSDTPSHSTAKAAAEVGAGQGRQHERRASPARRSPSNPEPHRGRSLSSGDAKGTTRRTSAFGTVNSTAAAPGRDGGRLQRAGEDGDDASAAKAVAAGPLTAGRRKGTNAGAEGPASGCGVASNGRTRGGQYNRRRKAAAATSDDTETRSPSARWSRYGPAAATRRGGMFPSTDRCAGGSAHSSGGAANQRQQQNGRDRGNNAQHGVTPTPGGLIFDVKASSGAATSTGRSPQYASIGAPEELSQEDCNDGSLQRMEGGRRGETTTRGGSSGEVSSVRTSPEAVEQRSPSLISRSPQQTSVQQQQLLQQQQVAQPRSSSDSRGEVAGRWSAAFPAEETEDSWCERSLRTFAGGAEGVWGRSGSRASILSRGSTRESACDPLAWEQADGPRPKGCPPKLSLQEAHQCLFPSPVPMTLKQVVSSRRSVDSGGGLVLAAKAAAGERSSVDEDLPWSGFGRGEEDDEAAQALAAALGGALDPCNGDGAVGAAGQVWEWLTVATGSKDGHQQDKLKQTLETLLNAWTTSGTNEGRHTRGTHSIEVPGSNSRNTMGSDGCNSSADGWFNFAVADYSCGRAKRSRPYQADEVDINPFDIAGNALHISGAVKGPPSEASTSFPTHEERTPPAERSAAEPSDIDASRSLATLENSTSSRRESTVCMQDGSSRTGRAAATEGGGTGARGTPPIAQGSEGGTGTLKPLRIPLPREVNRAHVTEYESDAAVFDGVTHNTIADFLLTYCNEDATAYEIAAQLKNRETAISAVAATSATTAASTSPGGVQAEAYLEPRLQEEKLVSTFSRAAADKLTKNCAASKDELRALRAEAVSASHSAGNSQAFSLSSFLTGSSPSSSH